MSDTIVIKNDGRSTIEFWLEPWGDGDKLPPDSTATVRFTEQADLDLEIQVEPGRVSVWVNSQTPPDEEDSRRGFVIHVTPPPSQLTD